MLTLPAPRRTELLQLLLTLPSPPLRGSAAPDAGAENGAAAAASVRAILEADGVFRLGTAEVRELLASIHEDG